MHLCRYNHVVTNIIVFFPQAYALMLWSITDGSCHKYHYSRDKSMLFATKLYFCRNETFVMTNISRDKHACHDKTFVATNTCLLRQKFCHDKHIFVATKDLFCLDKHMFLATNYKTFVPTKMILVAAPANDSGHTQPFCAGLPRWDTVEAEIKVPSVENTEHTNVLP